MLGLQLMVGMPPRSLTERSFLKMAKLERLKRLTCRSFNYEFALLIKNLFDISASMVVC